MINSRTIFAIRLTALLLIVMGAASLYHVGFEDLRVLRGVLKATAFDFSLWMGVAGLVLGGGLLVGFGSRR